MRKIIVIVVEIKVYKFYLLMLGEHMKLIPVVVKFGLIALSINLLKKANNLKVII